MPIRRFALLTLLSCAAGATPAPSRIEVVFNDPTASFGAYYTDIERVTLAAGNAWLDSFQHIAAGAGLTVQVGFAGIATASGRSLASAYLSTGADGLRLYQQGASYELVTGIDSNGGGADIELMLGSTGYLQGELWFDPAPALRLAPVPQNRTDAMSVLLHEFGHALGFNGWRDGFNGALPGDYQSTFDAQVRAQRGQLGTPLVFVGEQARGLYGGDLPLTWGSYGHLGNLNAGADLVPDLMNGVAFHRGTRYGISALDLQVMRDLGLPMLVAVPEPASAALALAGLALLGSLHWRRWLALRLRGLGAAASTAA